MKPGSVASPEVNSSAAGGVVYFSQVRELKARISDTID